MSFKTRLKIGKANVLSKFQYGADIVPLNANARAKFTSIHRKMLRVIFGVPRATDSRALLMIAGETPFCEKRMLYAEINKLRVRKNRNRTFSMLIRECSEFKNHSATAALFRDSSVAFELARRQSQIPRGQLNKKYAEFLRSRNPKHANALRKSLKQVLFENAHCSSVRGLMNSNSCSTFLLCYSRPQYSPLLRATGYQYSHFVQWLTNSIRIRDGFVLRNKEACPLCSTDFQSDARLHLLTSCAETEELREQFLQELLDTDQSKAAEFLSLPTDRSWLWILAAGCYPAPPPSEMYTGHRSPITSIFRVGRCYEI